MAMKRVGYFKVGKPKYDSVGRMVFRKIQEVIKGEPLNSFVMAEFGDLDLMYTFLSDYKTDQLKTILSKNKILIDYSDITFMVLSGNNVNNEFTKSFSDVENKEVLAAYIKENLTVDMVLDKILDSGIDSINEIDLIVLETKKP
jgi:hypothetical protein